MVAGTSVSVQRIAGWYKLGLSPEEIAEDFGHLSLAQVYAALAYYHSNREEIEGYLRDEDSTDAQVQKVRTQTRRAEATGCNLRDE